MKWKSHHLLDFGDSFGSDNDIARNPRHGQEFWLTSRDKLMRYDAGLFPASWEKAKYPHDLPAAGTSQATGFDPLTWKPNYPNPALLEMMLQDAYWGAKQVMSFNNEDIRAIVKQRQFSKPAVTDPATDHSYCRCRRCKPMPGSIQRVNGLTVQRTSR